MVRTGRRPGESRTREAILDAARSAFAQLGYQASTIRGIAESASVDPALVHHYFGTKERLFVEALQFPIRPDEFVPTLLAGDRRTIGERLARLAVSVWESPPGRRALLGILRSAMTNERAAIMLREFVAEALVGRVAESLGVPDARLRASLVASQLIGMAIGRYVIRVEPLASADPEHLVAWLAPTFQRYLTGEPSPRPSRPR
jgi:AcrR family transcriptional regulator